MSARLLPPNRTPLEAAVANATDFDADPSVIAKLWSADDCPAALLPWLAWSLSVDGWELADNEAERRALIKTSIDLHRHKGTVWAVEEAIKAAGYADAQIVEGLPILIRNGSVGRSGVELRNRGSWAVFRILLDIGEHKGIGAAEAARVRAAVERWKPARSHLKDLLYQATTSDLQAIKDTSASLSVELDVADVGVFGLRRNGSIRRNQTTQQLRDGILSRNSGAVRVPWIISGLTRNQQTDTANIALQVSDADSPEIRPIRDGGFNRNHCVLRGARNAFAADANMPISMEISLRRSGKIQRGSWRRDGTTGRDGSVRRQPPVRRTGTIIYHMEA
ncbi:phage tail protein I [Craterilacuibacter sp. RT1T]|uniref:phage tail protein I n=1 Tax=Craterilacuibacter sp. RT1T TaxID=2942211 RepID=UPI0020BDDC89|nr:phage tail protein I [Craterilacuibacter sp. RT1T]MCL6262175.1 phage tail protein I [Craterilacuibacter sp. RT1T]